VNRELPLTDEDFTAAGARAVPVKAVLEEGRRPSARLNPLATLADDSASERSLLPGTTTSRIAATHLRDLCLAAVSDLRASSDRGAGTSMHGSHCYKGTIDISARSFSTIGYFVINIEEMR
jgi:hypothetical protein